MGSITTKAISRSAVMQRAWQIFMSGHSYYSTSFTIALGRAWEIEKANIAYEAERVRIAEHEAWYKQNEEYIAERVHLTMFGQPSGKRNYMYEGANI